MILGDMLLSFGFRRSDIPKTRHCLKMPLFVNVNQLKLLFLSYWMHWHNATEEDAILIMKGLCLYRLLCAALISSNWVAFVAGLLIDDLYVPDDCAAIAKPSDHLLMYGFLITNNNI